MVCTCASQSPGISTRPAISSAVAPEDVLIGVSEISLMRPFVIRTSFSLRTNPFSTSRMRAFRRSIGLIAHPFTGGLRPGSVGDFSRCGATSRAAAPRCLTSTYATSQRRQRIHRTSEPLHMQLVELAIDFVEEYERVEPMQHAVFADLHCHVTGARTYDELQVELLVGIPLRE